jgi:hypothetical protein
MGSCHTPPTKNNQSDDDKSVDIINLDKVIVPERNIYRMNSNKSNSLGRVYDDTVFEDDETTLSSLFPSQLMDLWIKRITGFDYYSYYFLSHSIFLVR